MDTPDSLREEWGGVLAEGHILKKKTGNKGAESGQITAYGTGCKNLAGQVTRQSGMS